MSIEDERRTRAAARAPHEPQPRRRTPHNHGAREAGLERALDEVRKVGVEASDLLRREGLKPAKLVHVPRGARSYPLVGHAFSRVACGYGWHVIRGVVVGTDGRLWPRPPGGSTSSRHASRSFCGVGSCSGVRVHSRPSVPTTRPRMTCHP